MKVLITGSNGQVGSALVKQLQTMPKVNFLAVDRDQLDITDAQAVTEAVNEFKPDVIINAAAHTAVDKAENEVELSYAINRDGPLYLATAANNIGAAILHISTDYVFSGDKQGEYVETDATAPQSVYGASKLAGELAVAKVCARHIILRTAWVFGEEGNNFVKTMLRLMQSRDSLGVVADQFGGPTYAGDIATTLITMAQNITAKDVLNYGIYHYSGYPQVSWHQFALTIYQKAIEQSVLTRKVQINAISTADYPTPAKRPANSKLNCQKIENYFSILPSNWQASLDNIKEYK